ncbi:MAG TPA: hypothetical protein VGR71_13315, partial [Nitrospira sp.]|nr:hypothetical protein [Nitrospira sp.]
NPQQAFFTSLALSVSTAIVEPLLLFALPFAAIERLGKRPWLAALAAVLLAMLTGNGLNGTKLVPTVLEFMFAGVQVGFLAWAFWKTDLLSSMVAVYTIEVFALTYPVIQIFGQAERWVQQWSLIPWFLLALCGVFVWSQPHLTRGYRRVAAIFDPL